jgi:hypothetical protein
MKRLRELDTPTPLQRKAQQLITSVDPVSGSPERMARIRRRLDEPRGVMVSLRRLPALAIAALIGLFGASAFAAVRVFVEVQETRDAAVQPHTPAKKRAPKLEAPVVAQPVVAQPAVAQPLVEHRAVERELVLPTHRRPKAHAPAPVVVSAPEHEAHDSELVHRAVKALRVDGNPALAARLLEQDRIRNPSGPLAEEALSLRIEAALQLQDARARALGKQYVARYPSGRYLRIARQALSEDTSP